MDGHAKGGGAISAYVPCTFTSIIFDLWLVYSVAATQTPIIFLGVGEHLTDLDKFAPQPFISKMLGMGDMQGLMETIQDMALSNPDKHKEMAKKLEEGKLSIRDWREQINNVMSMYVLMLFTTPMCPLIIVLQGPYQQTRVHDSWSPR